MAEGEGAQSGAEGTQSGTGESTTGTTGSTGTATDAGAQSGTETGLNTEADRLAGDLAKQRERAQAADQRAAKFEAELKQLRDKDLPEAEKQTRELQEAQEKVSALAETNKALALQVAFLKDNTFTWHNPERALKLVDLSKVEVNEDGTVSGLKDALNALAKSDAYLVQADKTVEEVTPPPGTAPGNNGASGTGKPRTGALAGRLPVMNTRRKLS
jgi:cell division protein FtsB